jgi:hypothetical protein
MTAGGREDSKRHGKDVTDELAVTRRPDGEVVLNDAALGDWSTNPDYQQPPPDAREESRRADVEAVDTGSID